MKNLPYILTAIFAALALGPLTAQEESKRPPEKPTRPTPPKPEMIKQPFLGVATGPVHPSLRAQLGIDEGVGVSIHHVDPNSPANKVLKAHDILTKFGDQILVSHDQLAILVRNAGAGKEIGLTFIRGAKEQNANVAIGEHEVPKHAQRRGFPHMDFNFQRGGNPFNPQLQQDQQRRQIEDTKRNVERQMREAREQMENARRDMEQKMRKSQSDRPDTGIRGGVNPRRPATEVTVRNATWVQDELSLNFVENEKGKRLTVDRDGERIFDGPVDTEEQRAKIPEDVRDTFERLERQVDGKPTADKEEKVL